MLLDCNFEIDDDYIAQVRTPTRALLSVFWHLASVLWHLSSKTLLVLHFQVFLIFF